MKPMVANKSGWKLLALAAILFTTIPGCLVKRDIITAVDHPSAAATMIESQDAYWYVVTTLPQYQYWECKDEGKKLTCSKACTTPMGLGKGMDLLCPATPMGLSSGVQAPAFKK